MLCMPAKSFQSCLTLCEAMDYSPPSSSNPWDSLGKNTVVGSHSLLQGNLPQRGIEPECLESPALAGGFFTTSATQEDPKFS